MGSPVVAPPRAVVLESPSDYTGETDNLVEVKRDGLLKAHFDYNGGIHHGPMYDDLLGPATAATAGLSAPTVEAFGDTAYPAMFFRHDQDDDAWWTFQTSHRWDRTTPLYLHAHVVPMSDPLSAQVFYLDGSWAWAHYGAIVPAAADWTTITPVPHTVAPGAIRIPTIVTLATIPAGTALESDILIVKIRRPGSSNASDTYTTGKPGSGTAAANLCMLSVDCHYVTHKAGTQTEIPIR